MLIRSLTRIRLIPPAPAYEPAATHWPPGRTTRSSGACWPQMNCTSAVLVQGTGVGVGGCCATTLATAAAPSIRTTRVSFFMALTVQLPTPNAQENHEA